MSKDFLPAFSERNVPIVLASSAYYAPYMAVTIRSVLATGSTENNYDFILIHSAISQEDQQAICSLAEEFPNAVIRFLKIKDQFSQYKFNFRNDAAAATESFYCVLLQALLPNYDKVICMDCDVVVLEDIFNLYHIDLGNCLIGAVRDVDGIGQCYAEALGKNPSKKMTGRTIYMLETMGLSRVEDYFQSGVMLLNLKEWRNTFTIERIAEIACADWIVWGDQDTMNILCKNRVHYLDQRWNVIVNHKGKQLKMLANYGPTEILQEYTEARKAPAIIHYAGTKPWDEPLTDLFPFFWRYAVETPFYGEILSRVNNAVYQKEKNILPSKDPVGEVEAMYLHGRIGLRMITRFILGWLKYKLNRKKYGENACNGI